MQQVWDLWYPDAGAQGLSFARGRLDATEKLLVHATPSSLRVEDLVAITANRSP